MESYLFDEIKKPLRPFAFDKLQKIKTQKMLTTYYFLQLMMKMHEKVKDNRAAAENEAKFAHPRILIIAPRTDKDGKKTGTQR